MHLRNRLSQLHVPTVFFIFAVGGLLLWAFVYSKLRPQLESGFDAFMVASLTSVAATGIAIFIAAFFALAWKRSVREYRRVAENPSFAGGVMRTVMNVAALFGCGTLVYLFFAMVLRNHWGREAALIWLILCLAILRIKPERLQFLERQLPRLRRWFRWLRKD